MRIVTILNKTQKFKSFVFKKAKFGKMRDKQPIIEIEVVPRKGSRAICSGCQKKRPGYDTLPVRRYEHIPFWGFLVYFIYARRRVNCPKCGVKAEQIPWAAGKEHMTNHYHRKRSSQKNSFEIFQVAQKREVADTEIHL